MYCIGASRGRANESIEASPATPDVSRVDIEATPFADAAFNRFDCVASAGFEPHASRHAELLSDVNPGIAGVNAAEPFFLFRKSA